MKLRTYLTGLAIFALLAAPLAVFAQEDDAACGVVSLFDGWARATPEGAPTGAAYGLLVNLGGGVGLRVRSQDSQALAHHKLFWMRIVLPSELATPICASGKLVHTHMESNHDTYAGMAFDFSFNPMHQRFVVDQICRYIALQQRSQLQRFATQDDDAMVA